MVPASLDWGFNQAVASFPPKQKEKAFFWCHLWEWTLVRMHAAHMTKNLAPPMGSLSLTAQHRQQGWARTTPGCKDKGFKSECLAIKIPVGNYWHVICAKAHQYVEGREGNLQTWLHSALSGLSSRACFEQLLAARSDIGFSVLKASNCSWGVGLENWAVGP